MMNNDPLHTHRVPWLALFFLACAVVSYMAINSPSQDMRPYMEGNYGVSSSNVMPPTPMQVGQDRGTSQQVMESAGNSAGNSAMIAQNPNYYDQQYHGDSIPTTDTREFQKINYNASMRTRSVQDLTRRIETTIRGYKGRVDQTSSSPLSGYVSFVVPASTFEEFRTELETFVNPRFLSVNVNTQNMLPQKQGIESQQKSVGQNLADLKSSRQSLVSSHARTVTSLQTQISQIDTQLASLNAEITHDPVRVSEIANQRNILITQQSVLRSRLVGETSTYKANLAAYDQQIDSTKRAETGLQVDTTNLLDSVATVQGSVSIQWISLWEIILAYLPGNTIPGLFLLASLLSYVWHRRKLKILSS